MSRQVLPLIEFEKTCPQIILTEFHGDSDFLPVWIAIVKYYTEKASNANRSITFLTLNPRCEKFLPSNLNLLTSIDDLFEESNFEKLQNSLCFIDSFSLIALKYGSKAIGRIENYARQFNTVFIISLPINLLPESHLIDNLRPISLARLLFAKSSHNESSWNFQLVSSQSHNLKVTRKDMVVVCKEMEQLEVLKTDNNRKNVPLTPSNGSNDVNAVLFGKLPFNLSLSDSEQVTRSQVVLPHTKIVGKHGTPVQELDVFEQQEKEAYEKMKNELDPDDDLDI